MGPSVSLLWVEPIIINILNRNNEREGDTGAQGKGKWKVEVNWTAEWKRSRNSLFARGCQAVGFCRVG